MRSLATRLGLAYEARAGVDRLVPPMRLFAHAPRGRLDHLMAGPWHGVDVQLFDLTYPEGRALRSHLRPGARRGRVVAPGDRA